MSSASPRRLLATGLLALSTLAAAPASASDLVSAYTRHDYPKCAAQPSPHPDVVEIRQCRGLAGIPVIWTGEPDASSVEFGRASEAAIPHLDTFFEVQGTVEWRGPVVEGAVKPVAAIVRYDTGPAIGRLGATRLVVYRLSAGGGSCVMGVVKGSAPDANGQARALVDRAAKDFVCGRSAPSLRS